MTKMLSELRNQSSFTGEDIYVRDYNEAPRIISGEQIQEQTIPTKFGPWTKGVFKLPETGEEEFNAPNRRNKRFNKTLMYELARYVCPKETVTSSGAKILAGTAKWYLVDPIEEQARLARKAAKAAGMA